MQMYVRVTKVRVWPGRWFEYEAATQRLCIESRRIAPAWRAGCVIRSLDDPDSGLSVSVWDSLEDLQAYEETEMYRGRVLPELERYLSGEIPVERGEVRYVYEAEKGWLVRSSHF